MSIKLHIVNSQGAVTEKEFAWDGNTALSLDIGREGKDITLTNDPKISRHHCVLDFASGAAKIKDNKSTNGFSVNEQRVTESPLNSGDVIQIGTYQLKIANLPKVDRTEIIETPITPTSTPPKQGIIPPLPQAVIPPPAEIPVPPPMVTPSPKVPSPQASESPSTETDKFNFHTILHWLIQAWTSPKTFFQNISFDLPIKNSLIIIGAAGTAGIILQNILTPLALLMTLPAGILALALGFGLATGYFHLPRNFWGSKAKLNEVIGFLAVWSVVSLPLKLIPSFLFFLSLPVSVALSVYFLWGFSKSFGANFKKLLIVPAVLLVVFGIPAMIMAVFGGLLAASIPSIAGLKTLSLLSALKNQPNLKNIPAGNPTAEQTETDPSLQVTPDTDSPKE